MHLDCRRRDDVPVIEVADTGIGIPEHRCEQIFQEFTQLSPERGDGLGLGLWIVRRAADALGIRLDLSSEVGKGTCFTIEVPVAKAERVDSAMAVQ